MLVLLSAWIPSSPVEIVKVPPDTVTHDVKMYSAWRRNVLVFKSAPLSDVMKTLARTYDISFDVKDSAALRYTYTITTDSVNLTTVLKELEKITPVLFEEKGGKIEVRMKK